MTSLALWCVECTNSYGDAVGPKLWRRADDQGVVRARVLDMTVSEQR